MRGIDTARTQVLSLGSWSQICKKFTVSAVCPCKTERGVKSSQRSRPRTTIANDFLSHALSASASGMLGILSDFNEIAREFLLKGVCVGWMT